MLYNARKLSTPIDDPLSKSLAPVKVRGFCFTRVAGFERSTTEGWREQVSKTYDAYNRLATETDARGKVKTHTYEHARGLHLGTTYTVIAYFWGRKFQIEVRWGGNILLTEKNVVNGACFC